MDGLHGLGDDWDLLSKEGKQRYIQSFFNRLVKDIDRYEDFILDIIDLGTILEQDDYFGTEGFKFD